MRVSFARGVPPDLAIPSEELRWMALEVLEDPTEAPFQYSPLGRFRGDPGLREEIGAWQGADPDAVFVGNGSLQVLDLLAGLLLARRGDVIVEAPTYDRAMQIFERHGARVVGVPLEADGLDVEAVRSALVARAPAFLYTIPDFQNPSGVTMSADKRRALVALAAEFGFPIIEDSPYRELRYVGEAPPTLAELAAEAHVITVSSLSKVLSPGLRIGYAIADPETSEQLAALAEATYLSPAPLAQSVARRSLASGLVHQNIERVRALLRPRCLDAIDTVGAHFGDAMLAAPEGGYYIGIRLPPGLPEPELLAAASAAGLSLTRGSSFYPRGNPQPDDSLFVRLPFQAHTEAEFEAGVATLARAAQVLIPE